MMFVKPDFDGALTLGLIGVPIVGAVILMHRPGNRIGQLMLGAGIVAVISSVVDSYVRFAVEHEGWPAVEWAAWLSSWTFWGPLECYLVLLLLMFPTGKLLSPRWRVVVTSIVFVTTVQAILDMFQPGPISGNTMHAEVSNPLGVATIGTIRETAIPLTDLLLLLTIVAAVLSTIVRFHRSQGIERRQVKAFVSVAVTIILLILAMIASSGSIFENVFGVMFLFGIVVGLPVTIGVAILRYRLYEIDWIINRTLVYGLLTATLLALYLGLVLVLGSTVRRLTGGDSSIVTAASTLTVAAMFRPLRARIQFTVDRHFNRSHYDASRTLDGFNARLREQIDLGTLSRELQSVVNETMQPAHVSLWFRPSVLRAQSGREGEQ
jgi:hypothetical protein